MPEGIGTAVGDGTGVGAASIHGMVEPNGEPVTPGLVRAVGGVMATAAAGDS